MQHFSKVSGPIPASIPQTMFHACKGCKSWRRRVAADSASLDTASAPSRPLRRCSFSAQSSLTLRGPLRFNPGFFASKANRSPVIRRPVCFVVTLHIRSGVLKNRNFAGMLCTKWIGLSFMQKVYSSQQYSMDSGVKWNSTL